MRIADEKNSDRANENSLLVPVSALCFKYVEVVLGGIVVSVLSIGPEVHGFKLGQGQWIFKDD
jgi:hypothetical protein